MVVSTIGMVAITIAEFLILNAFILFTILPKQDRDNFHFIQLYLIIGLTNIIISLVNAIGGLIRVPMEFVGFYYVPINLVLFPILQITTLGIFIIFIGLKNQDIEGHFLFIAGLFFMFGYISFLNGNIVYYEGYLESPYYSEYSGIIAFRHVYYFGGSILLLLGSIYMLKFSARNDDNFRKIFSILLIVASSIKIVAHLLSVF